MDIPGFPARKSARLPRVLTVVTVAAEKDVVERRLADVADFIRSNPQVILIDYMTEMI